MARKTDEQYVYEVIEMLSLRNKQFVPIKKRLMPNLQRELSAYYPHAKFTYFGFGNGDTFNCKRTSAAKTFKII